jgi:O-antigen ligase
VFGYKPLGKNFGQLIKAYWAINIATMGLLLAVFINHSIAGNFDLKNYEVPARLAIFPVIFMGLLLLSVKELRYFQWALLVSAVAASIALYIDMQGGALRPGSVLTVPLIPFTNITFLLSALVLLSIGWNQKREKLAIAAKLLVGLFGLYACYLSKNRGTWVAIFVLAGIFFSFTKSWSRNKKTGVLLVIIALLAAISSTESVKARMAAAESDIYHYIDGTNLNTSVGQRLQLWRGSWVLFTENPLQGVGRERFQESLQNLASRQVITVEAAKEPHSHNDLLFQLASFGIAGGCAMLALYLVPGIYFFKNISAQDKGRRTIAGMGLMLTIGFFIFGLSDTMFYWPISYTFYCIVLASLFAHSEKIIHKKSKNFIEENIGSKIIS